MLNGIDVLHIALIYLIIILEFQHSNYGKQLNYLRIVVLLFPIYDRPAD